ncbi:unnamed protein product [Closterium sp. Naga37s-1]|nr:unnamed protein product [Closterium sp. Naga37s-1]
MNEFGAGFAGILSRKGHENPTFNDWNAVLVVYCDGGLYAGSRGAYTANLTSPFFLEGHASLASVIHDLRLRGLGSARNVLFSGCSAGAQAVAMTCDAMARALPSASVKCLMDAGFFLDTPDIQGRLTWRQSVERLFKFHRMGLGVPPACRQGSSSSTAWGGRPARPPAKSVRVWVGTHLRVISHGARHSPLASPPLSVAPHVLSIPPTPTQHHTFSSERAAAIEVFTYESNLPFLRSLLLINITLPYPTPCFSSLSLPPSRLLPSSPPPPSPFPFLPHSLFPHSTRTGAMEVPTPAVQPAIPPHAPHGPRSAPHPTALHLYQSRLARTVLGIQRVKRQQGVWFESFLMNSTSHCSAVYGEWVGKVDVLGRQLPRVVEEWFFHGKRGGAGVPGGAGAGTGGGGAGKSGVGAGAGDVGSGAGGVGKGGAGGAGKAAGSVPTRPVGSKGGWAGGRQGGQKPKAPGVQAGSAGPGKVPGTGGAAKMPGTGGAVKAPGTGAADQMGTGGRQGGEKGAGGAAGKGQQQQGAGKSAVKRPGTGIGKGPGVGAGAGKAPGGQRGALWPGVRGVRGKGRGGLAGTSSEEQMGGRRHGRGGKSGRKGRKSGKRRGGKSGRKGGKSAGRGVGSKEGGRRSEARNSGPETVIVTEE